ncbi:MAG: type IX secretion system membrane protein PorP/SprF [Bacteroidetes bacterium]|nr:type IX secretion system membrane protein PorP/SprF [Bacteroidota bacterium]
MRRSYTLIAILSAVLSLATVSAGAQGIRHYWLNNQVLYNPAMTGASEDVVGSLIFNQQQANFPGAPRTLLAQANGRLGYTSSSLGGAVSYEEYSVVKNYSATLSYSYGIKLKKGRRLMLGLSGSFGAIQENGSSLTTTFNGDDIFKLNTTAYQVNVAVGAAYVTKNFYVSFSVPKLVHNAYDYAVAKNRYSLEKFNFNLMAGYDLKTRNDFHFMPSFMIRSDKQERFNADINLNFKYKEVFWFGPYYRVNAAFGFILGVGITKYVQLSYAGELQQTKFRTSSYGNHEVILGFKIPKFNTRIAQSPRYF